MHLTGSRRCQPSHWSTWDSLSNKLNLAIGQRLTCPLPGASAATQRTSYRQVHHPSASPGADPPGTAHPTNRTQSWGLQVGPPPSPPPSPGVKAQCSGHRTSCPLSCDLCPALAHCAQLDFFQEGTEREGWGLPKASHSLQPLSPGPGAQHQQHHSHSATARSI